jgi:hypothetical protein|tara:strand:- start:985 stop:1164 length:180 start_codon:yes stop_codon:yes gene_type:complete
MTYNDKIMEDLKHAIKVWSMVYLVEKGIDPRPHITNCVGKIEVTIDPVETRRFDRGEEE